VSLVLLSVSGPPRGCVSAFALPTHLHLSTRLGLRLRSSLGASASTWPRGGLWRETIHRIVVAQHVSGCRRHKRGFAMDFFGCDKDASVVFLLPFCFLSFRKYTLHCQMVVA
jgi:hypothetical protein